MTERDPEKTLATVEALNYLPPIIRDGLLSSGQFREKYGIRADSKISFGDHKATFVRSALFESIRTEFTRRSSNVTIVDEDGLEWKLQITDPDTGQISLSQGADRLTSTDFWPLHNDNATRLRIFDEMCEEANLPPNAQHQWRDRISLNPLLDDEVYDFWQDARETPFSFRSTIESDIRSGRANCSSLVPNSRRYFERLAGRCDLDSQLPDFVQSALPDHVRCLMSWRYKKGLSLALLLSSHSSVVDEIKIDPKFKTDVIEAYESIESNGDLVSQLGAIELGISQLHDWPEIEACLTAMLKRICEEDPDDSESRFGLLSSLIIMVEGELSLTKVLLSDPPFWRRLAAIAHASLIERAALAASVNFSKFQEWARQNRGTQYYLQTLCDLRREPKWMPDFIEPNQLKAEFVARIIGVAKRHESQISSQNLRQLLFGKDSKSVESQLIFPDSFLPGPLEGGTTASLDLPSDIADAIARNLAAEQLEPGSFAALINSTLVFKLEATFAELAAKALRDAKHRLRQIDQKGSLFQLLCGLAVLAGVTRSIELSNELRILNRRAMRTRGRVIRADDALRIGLISAAAYNDISSWCSYLGDWINELAFEELTRDEAKRLHGKVQYLCHVVPELWSTAGKAEAALNAYARA